MLSRENFNIRKGIGFSLCPCLIKGDYKMNNCFNCNNTCNRLCPNYIISRSVTIVTVDGTDTVLIDLPLRAYGNCCTYTIIVAQPRPSTATVDMPVAISINGVTTTVYPLICGKTGLQAVACQIDASGRQLIKAQVRTNVTSGIFRACQGLHSCCTMTLNSLPIKTTTAAANTPAPANVAVRTAVASAPKKASTKSSTVDNMTVNASTVNVNKEDK